MSLENILKKMERDSFSLRDKGTRFEELINIAKSNNFEIIKLLEPYSSEKEFNRLYFLIIKLKKVGNR